MICHQFQDVLCLLVMKVFQLRLKLVIYTVMDTLLTSLKHEIMKIGYCYYLKLFRDVRRSHAFPPTHCNCKIFGCPKCHDLHITSSVEHHWCHSQLNDSMILKMIKFYSCYEYAYIFAFNT